MKFIKHLFLALLLLAPFATVHAAAEKVPLKAEAFDLREVQLLEGPFKHAQDVTHQLLLKMDSNRLLYPFRREAGIPSPVKGPDELNYANTGHTLGHYLSACAQLYRSTRDTEIKKKADALVAVLAECQEKLGTGFIGGFPERTFNFKKKPNDPPANAIVPWYCLHKVYAGLLDMYLLADNRQALEVLKKAADWADGTTSELTEANMQGMLTAEHGGMNEVMANLYAVTGEEKYLRLSLRFNHHSYLDPFGKGEDPFDGIHANTQIPKFIGVARQYQLTGDPTQNAIATNFWDAVTRDRSYVTGGNSLHERFTPKGHLSHFVTGWNCESCNEYNMLKLTRYLIGVNPKADYADYYERTLFNHVLSSRHPETGGQSYFQILQSGHFKGEPTRFLGWRYLFNEGPEAASYGHESSCCSGSGLESSTKFADSIYFHKGETALYVNQFIPSVLDWKGKGTTLRQETRYPEQGSTRLLLTCGKPVALKLLIRHPWWATKDFQILVNGNKQEIASTPGSYAQIERTWKTGDKVDVVMPMSLRVEGFQDNPKRVAVMYGPLVMAAVTEHGNPFSTVEAKDERFLETLKPVEGKPLEFTGPPSIFRMSPLAVAEKPVTFRPLYSIFGDSYAVYWDILTPADFRKMACVIESELQRHKIMEPKTADMVLCGMKSTTHSREGMFTFQSYFLENGGWMPRSDRQVSDASHNMKRPEQKPSQLKGMDAYAWIFASEMPFNLVGDFRSIDSGSWCSYQMKALPQKEQQLEVRLWKSQFKDKEGAFKQGVLEVLVEGKVLGSCNLEALPAGQFSVASFPLKHELLNGMGEGAEVRGRAAAPVA